MIQYYNFTVRNREFITNYVYADTSYEEAKEYLICKFGEHEENKSWWVISCFVSYTEPKKVS